MSKLVFTERAWDEYLLWQSRDRKTIKRINIILKDIAINGYKGIGKPEQLKHRDGWSRRIDDTNRLVYRIDGDNIEIVQCRSHYDD